jgi:hypothetical protein
MVSCSAVLRGGGHSGVNRVLVEWHPLSWLLAVDHTVWREFFIGYQIFNMAEMKGAPQWPIIVVLDFTNIDRPGFI